MKNCPAQDAIISPSENILKRMTSLFLYSPIVPPLYIDVLIIVI